MKKSLIRILGFFAVLAVVLGRVNHVLSFKYSDGIAQHKQFYKLEKNSVDVLILGSSHAFVNFNHGTLYEEYGIASYSLGASNQTTWNTYYDLKEALKTQTPELIIMEGYGTSFDYEYGRGADAIKSLFGMCWSKDKIENLKVSQDPGWDGPLWPEYSIYHTRYTDLKHGDFLDDYGNQNIDYDWYSDSWKGQYLLSESNPREIKDVSGVTDVVELSPKTEEYYRKTLELAQKHQIPILVVITPYSLGEYEQGKYMRAEQIAKEYGSAFLNSNLYLEDTGLDLSVDFNDNGHLNAIGTRTFSRYIGDYLKEHYTLSDRRGDVKYQSWQENADYTNRYIQAEEVSAVNSMEKLSEVLNNPEYWVFLTLDGACDASDVDIRKFFDACGIPVENPGRAWIKQNGDVIWTASDLDCERYVMGKYRDFAVICDPNTQVSNIFIDNETVKMVENGLNVVIYDPELNIIVDEIGIDVDNNKCFTRDLLVEE